MPWGSWEGPAYHIMVELAKRHQVAYIQRLQTGGPLRRLLGRPTLFKGWKPYWGERNLVVHTFVAPVPYATHLLPQRAVPLVAPVIRRVNDALFCRLVRHIVHDGRPARPILWLMDPLSRGLLGTAPWHLTLYHCYDQIAAFPQNQRIAPLIKDEERQIVEKVDLVLAVSQALYGARRAWNPNTHYVPNGADFHHFSQAREETTAIPSDMGCLSHPILGYMGTVDFRMDLELLLGVAQERPQWNIVIVGEARNLGPAWHRLLAQPNVHFLGKKPYPELPCHLKAMDVCLIPWHVDKATAAMYPIKLHEYLAAGKPVVATPIPSLLAFDGVIAVAGEIAEFIEATAHCLAQDSPKQVMQRVKLAQENSWEKRASQIEQIMAEFLSNGREEP